MSPKPFIRSIESDPFDSAIRSPNCHRSPLFDQSSLTLLIYLIFFKESFVSGKQKTTPLGLRDKELAPRSPIPLALVHCGLFVYHRPQLL